MYGFYDELRHRIQDGDGQPNSSSGFGFVLSPTKNYLNNIYNNYEGEENALETSLSSELWDSFESSHSTSINNKSNTSNKKSNKSSKSKKSFGESGISLWRKFLELFDCLPIGAVIDGDLFCAHGGIPRDANTISSLVSLNRHGEVPFEGEICDLLWSDPVESLRGKLWEPNSRGAGIGFSQKLLGDFLRKNGLEKMYRSHQLVMEGFKKHWDENNLVTVWSAPNYCYRCGNMGSIAWVRKNGRSVDGNKEEMFDCFGAVGEEERRKPKAEERMDFMREL